ncbi:histidine kinase/DNA gyrase B/HSP90-like ATPase [Geodermatophilus normandii]|uniref:histidine kinase n=1 Tax=Geodermatophilus normandii TaxID=1137989 RepID=A0A317QGV9_9ACTN|nr:ATP-binding protein [Geodermatophilus normandii]PWW22309.1 histidine kinase/DNA gyrase B/HSP90-like ATPase [Geodermatophilus normandii]
MITAADLRSLPLFGKVGEDELRDLIALGEETAFEAGDELWTQGGPASCWWVLLDGRIDLVRTVGDEETLLGAMDAPGRWAGGFQAWDEHAVYLATGRASADGRALRVGSEALKDWTRTRDPFGAHLIEGVFRTQRTVESAARQRDALVALGTLAAGLAHELNNPAAAATRAVDALGIASDQLLRTLAGFADGGVSAGQLAALDGLRRELRRSAAEAQRDPMALADQEDALSDWLDDHHVEEAWTLAGPLATAGADGDWCERAADVLGPSLGPGLAWVVSTLALNSLLSEVKEATRRISDLVGAVRSYSQLDRAAVQRTVLAEGLESTLVILGHQIPAGITVVRDYSPDTPEVEGIPGELNQVWTNLIGNALDAMDGSGTLRLSTRPERDGVVVEVGDTGTWSDPAARDRAFEPFFTTKGVGQGTGLGLDISRRIVVGRHGGDIAIDLRPGETVLRVWLPLRYEPVRQ